jgi:hypothetical protein
MHIIVVDLLTGERKARMDTPMLFYGKWGLVLWTLHTTLALVPSFVLYLVPSLALSSFICDIQLLACITEMRKLILANGVVGAGAGGVGDAATSAAAARSGAAASAAEKHSQK